MIKKIASLFFAVVLFAVLGEGFYVEFTGRSYFLPGITYPLAILGMLFAWFIAVNPERKRYREKYRLFLSKNPEAQAQDQRVRQRMYVGIGLIPLSIILTVLARFLIVSNIPEWIGWIVFACALSMFVIGGELILYRMTLWWWRYTKDTLGRWRKRRT